MNLKGRRIHIVRSAASNWDVTRVAYAHSMVAKLVDSLVERGATFVLPFGKEPFLDGRTDGPAQTFDWTVAATLHQAVLAGRASPEGPNGKLITTIATAKTADQIPTTRRPIYDGFRDRNALRSEFIEPGWSAGAFRRQRLAQLGDILIGISGGEGVEHLALEYSTKGKPVIPLDLNLGSSQHDGSGGAARLFLRALAKPADFFQVVRGASPADLLDRTRTHDGSAKIDTVVPALIALMEALLPPRVFYIRLLNSSTAEYPSVEGFFRKTVDTFVKELGYEPCQMGIGENQFAWMNEAIFQSLHHSSVALFDATGVRPNCFMEFGYALGNRQRVIATHRKDTKLPFDSSMIESFPWEETEDPTLQLARFRDHWVRNINMPTIVRPTEAR